MYKTIITDSGDALQIENYISSICISSLFKHYIGVTETTKVNKYLIFILFTSGTLIHDSLTHSLLL